MVYNSDKPIKTAIEKEIFIDVPFELSDKRTHKILTVDYVYVNYALYPSIEENKLNKEFSYLVNNSKDSSRIHELQGLINSLYRENLEKSKSIIKRSDDIDNLYDDEIINIYKRHSKIRLLELALNKNAYIYKTSECKCLKQVYEHTCLFVFNDEKRNVERKIFAVDDNDAKEIAENIALKNNYTFIGLI